MHLFFFLHSLSGGANHTLFLYPLSGGANHTLFLHPRGGATRTLFLCCPLAAGEAQSLASIDAFLLLGSRTLMRHETLNPLPCGDSFVLET